jgi:death-on-curing protein
MADPEWLEFDSVVSLHDRSLALHGGAEGIRDPGLLESALARPQNRFAYDAVEDIAELAATYAAAISANHPFADGNKRAAFQAALLFLRLNGYRLQADREEAAAAIYSLAAGELDIPTLAAWIRARWVPTPPPAL